MIDARSFLSLRAELASRLGAPIAGLALIDAESNVTAADSGLVSLLGSEGQDVVGQPLKWVFGKLGLPKKTETSDLMASPLPTPAGQLVSMSLTASGLAICVSQREEPAVSNVALIETEEVNHSVNVAGFAYACSISQSLDELCRTLEHYMPGTGALALRHGPHAFCVSHWGADGAIPIRFSSADSMALRLGRVFPEPQEQIPFASGALDQMVSFPVSSSHGIVALLIVDPSVDRSVGSQVASLLSAKSELLS